MPYDVNLWTVLSFFLLPSDGKQKIEKRGKNHLPSLPSGQWDQALIDLDFFFIFLCFENWSLINTFYDFIENFEFKDIFQLFFINQASPAFAGELVDYNFIGLGAWREKCFCFISLDGAGIKTNKNSGITYVEQSF